MKKLIALLLALTMVLCLAACGGKTTDDTKPSDTPSTTAPVTDPTEETIDVAAKQAFYDTYFTSAEYKTAGDSYKASNDYFSMSQVIDAEGYGMLEIAVQDYFVRMYRTPDGVLLHTHGPTSENPSVTDDAWLKYVEAEGENTLTDNTLNESGAPELVDIKKVTYVETKDGLDHVTVEVPNEEYQEGMKYTEYTLQFSYEEQQYNITLYEVTGEGTYMASWLDIDELPEDLDMTDYKLDVENSNLVHEEDTTKSLTCTISETKDVTPAATNIFDMYIDAETHKVVKVGSETDGAYTMMEYFTVEKYEPDVAFPSEVSECTAEEMGLILFGFLMMSMQA